MPALTRLVSAELTKATRQKLPWVGLIFSAFWAIVARHSVERTAAPGELCFRTYMTFDLNLVSTSVIPIFSTVFAAMLMASETSRGTLRSNLPRPIYRSQFLHAKVITGALYVIALFLANVIIAMPIALSYPLYSSLDEGIALPSKASQAELYALALLLTFLPHIASVCFATMISVISRTVATAIGVAVGIIFCLLPIQIYARIGTVDFSNYIFINYWDDAFKIADSNAGGMFESWNQDNVHLLFTTSLISSAVFLAIAYLVFTRRDLNGIE